MKADKVLEFFYQITKIPRPSGQEEAITDYLISFAKERGLAYTKDSANNVIICKDASPDCETTEPIILQAHTDMVCEKESDNPIDMNTTGITTFYDGDWIKALGTTLGADDGIGMAMMLTLLDSTDIHHPPLECVFTATEETGMDGAFAIDISKLKGKTMINLDSEDEGVFFLGCAGGGRCRILQNLNSEPFDSSAIKVSIDNLTGGHSGSDIDKYSANANILLAKILQGIKSDNLRIVDFTGGFKDNAIPRAAAAVITVPDSEKNEVISNLYRLYETAIYEYQHTDPDASFKVEETTGYTTAITSDDSRKLLALMIALPNGVQRMSSVLPNLVETSLNLGVVRIDDNTISLTYAIRSSILRALEMLKGQMNTISAYFGATTEIYNEYPGWEYNPNSKICSVAKAAYYTLYEKEPVITAIHAGLECGILKEKRPDIDMISIGPDIKGVHSPLERLSLDSTNRTWVLLCKILERY